MNTTMRFAVSSLSLAAIGLTGCATQRPPQAMAPPVPAQAPVQAGVNNVYDWHDVPAGQQIPLTRAAFDQGGYQLYAASGETIVVPFENQNMYVMKFGRTNGEMYFINEGGAPTVYLREGMFLQNNAADGARWYPFPQNYNYTRPVYMGLAPTWSDYVAMGWYPGMHYYGGYWGYSPWRAGLVYAAMPGLVINIGGRPYSNWTSYSNYYRSNPTNRFVVGNSRGFNYSSVRRGSTGSFGSSSMRRTTSGGFSSSRPGSTGSFGQRPSTLSRPGTGFSASRPSFNSGARSSSFGSSGARSSSFGSGSSSGFGSTSRRTGSFGGSSSGFSSSRPSSGGSFGSSSGRSFGGGGRSFGGGGRRR